MQPPTGEWVTIAVLVKPRGNRGELIAIPYSSRPERFYALREVFLFGDGQRYEVERVWEHDGKLILKFAGVETISAAEEIQGAEVRVPAAQRVELEPGEYFQEDLAGCEVVERGAGGIGRVARFIETGAAGLLELEDGTLIPFARSICVEIDPAARRIVVELPEGLKDLNRK